jgi:hypothetical protein
VTKFQDPPWEPLSNPISSESKPMTIRKPQYTIMVLDLENSALPLSASSSADFSSVRFRNDFDQFSRGTVMIAEVLRIAAKAYTSFSATALCDQARKHAWIAAWPE